MPHAALRLTSAAFLSVLALGAPAASAAWHEPASGAAPINHTPDRDAYEPSLSTVAGVPYVAWAEWNAAHTSVELRVSRLNADGTAWEEPGGGATAVNHSSDEDASDPSLTAIGDVPYVAWSESAPGAHPRNVIRVSRLNAAGTAWEELGAGFPADGDLSSAGPPSLAAVDGVPYVAWSELAPGPHQTMHVSRLNAAGTAWEEVGGQLGGEGAVNPSLIVIDGVPYVAFEEPGAGIRVMRLNAAGTAWEDVAGGDAIVHNSVFAGRPQLAAIGGVPYLSWIDAADPHGTIRVSRVNAAGTAWEEPVGGDNPLNQPDAAVVGPPRLAEIGGEAYVAWTESDGASRQLRVSRLNATETAWVQVAGAINHASDHQVFVPSLSAVGGVPYVAWTEYDDSHVAQTRVSRLEPEFISQTALATNTEALLLTRVRTYGVAYPIAFQYGLGNEPDQRTAITPTAYDDNEDTVFQSLTDLKPGETYSWRPIGFDGRRTTGVGPTATFRTFPASNPRRHGHHGHPHDPPASDDPAPPQDSPAEPAPRLVVAVIKARLRATAGRKVTISYLLTDDADVRLEVRRCDGRLVASAPRRVSRSAAPTSAGRNRITWNGKVGGAAAKPGCYVLTVKATSSDGRSASDDAILRVSRRSRGPKHHR